MVIKKARGMDRQRMIIGILLALMMIGSVIAVLTHLTSGSDVTQTTVRNGYIVNPDNVTISMDGNTTSVLIGQNVQFMCDGNKSGPVTIRGIPGTLTEVYVFYSSSTGWFDTSMMAQEGLYNATYGVDWELIAVSMPVIDLNLKVGTKEVASICSGTSLRVDFMSNLDENDCVDLKVIDPDGSVIKIINNQKFDDINVSQLLEYGSMNESKQINTTGWKVGTYTFSVRTEEENARGLDVSSSTLRLAILKAGVDITALKISIVELEKVRLAVTGAPRHNITINSSDPEHTIFPAGYGDNPPYDTSGFNDTIDEDGVRRYVVYFNDTGSYTIRVTDTTAGLYDTVDISVSEKKVTFDVSSKVIIGEKFTIKGTVNTGNTLDIAVEDYVYPQLNDIAIKADRTFEKEIDTATTNITPFTVPGSVRLKAYIDRDAEAGEIGENESFDGAVAILMVEGGLTVGLNVSISKSTVSPGDSFEVYGNASSDYVEIVAISQGRGNRTGLAGLYGVSIYTIPALNPCDTGSYKIHVFINRTISEDLTKNDVSVQESDGSVPIIIIIKAEINISAEKTSVVVGEIVKLKVEGITGHNITINSSDQAHTIFRGGMEDYFGPDTGGPINGTIDEDGVRTYAVEFNKSGSYTITVTDTTADVYDYVDISVSGRSIANFYKKIKVDSGADTGNYTILVLTPGIDGVYGSSSYKYIESILDLDGAGPELGAIDVSNMTQEELVGIIKNVTINQAGSDDLLHELHLLVNHPPIASFTYYPENPVVNQNITFNVSSSYDPDGQIVSFQLDFGDGGEVGGTWSIGMIEHAYPSAGDYTVNLTVTDNNGVANSASKIVTVKENFIINGDFSNGLNNWTERGYGRGNRQVEVVYDDALNSSVLEFKRWNSGADGGMEGVYQNLSINVSEYKSLYLEADIKVISNTLGDSGWWSDVYGGDGEIPVHIFLYYKDENGTDWVWTHGFLPVKDYWNRRNYDVVNRSEWYRYVSPNLVNVSTTTTKPHNVPIYSPPPKTITGIFLGGNGWDFCGRIDNARLYGEKGTPIPSIIYVPDDYAKIQWAVDNVSAGSTIIVRDGTYIENVVINKGLTLKSENGSANCIVDGGGSGDVISLSADGITLEGFTITNSGSYVGDSGINITSSNNNITDNNISNNGWYGIRFSSSSNNKITGNNISNNNGDGICLKSSSSNNIIGNSISNNELGGIYFYDSSNNNIITGNNISNNGDGIDFWDSSNNNITENKISNNNYDGIHLYFSSNNNIIIGNTISNNNDGILLWYSIKNNITANNFVGGGLYVRYSYQNTVINNTVNSKPLVYLENIKNIVVEDAGQVILVNCNNVTVESLNLSNTKVGMELWETSNAIIKTNTISNNYWGIYLHSSSNNSITGNNISNNNGDGIFLYSSSNNNIITKNNISNNNYCGTYLSSSSNNNIITENNISNNKDDGIYLWHSSNNNITGNKISNNGQRGIYLYSSSKNKIFLNNFINNTRKVNSYNSTNIWNSTEEISYIYDGNTYTSYLGNYWSDYTGNDTNNDGIGDIPYSIDSDNDSYPLMQLFNEYFQKSLVTELNINPEVAEPGDIITITGKALPNESVWLNSSFELALPVSEGRYSREFKGIHFIAGEKVFSVTIENIKNVRASIYPVFWQTIEYPLEGPLNATNGTATISVSFPATWHGITVDISGRKDVKVYGDAAENATSVTLKVATSIKVNADSNGDFLLDINTEGVPEGEFVITAGELEKTVYIGVTPTPTPTPPPCFIATAAYGTPLHEDIDVLRDFRDEYLMTNPAGKGFVKLYYETSPPIAELISEHEWLRTAVREGFVKPLVYITRKFVG